MTNRGGPLKRHSVQTVTVRTVSGASVRLEIQYPNGVYSVRNGSAAGGVYRYKWRVPKARGRVGLLATVSTQDGGEGTAHGSFRIR
jgi:hypothetical protein